MTHSFDKKLVIKMLRENLAKEKAGLAALPELRRTEIEKWRKEVLAFAREAIKRGGKLADSDRFYRAVTRDNSADHPCLENLAPPKPPTFYRTKYDSADKIKRMQDRITSVTALPEAHKFRMSEERFADYVKGRRV